MSHTEVFVLRNLNIKLGMSWNAVWDSSEPGISPTFPSLELPRESEHAPRVDVSSLSEKLPLA